MKAGTGKWGNPAASGFFLLYQIPDNSDDPEADQQQVQKEPGPVGDHRRFQLDRGTKGTQAFPETRPQAVKLSRGSRVWRRTGKKISRPGKG